MQLVSTLLGRRMIDFRCGRILTVLLVQIHIMLGCLKTTCCCVPCAHRISICEVPITSMPTVVSLRDCGINVSYIGFINPVIVYKQHLADLAVQNVQNFILDLYLATRLSRQSFINSIIHTERFATQKSSVFPAAPPAHLPRNYYRVFPPPGLASKRSRRFCSRISRDNPETSIRPPSSTVQLGELLEHARRILDEFRCILGVTV